MLHGCAATTTYAAVVRAGAAAMFGVTPAAVAASVVSGVCVGAFNAVTTGGVVAAGGTLRDWKGGRSGGLTPIG